MPGRSIGMRKVREIIRLNELDLSQREIARSCDVSPSTVSKILEEADAAALDWSRAASLNEGELKRLLTGGEAEPPRPATDPDWAALWRRLKAKGMTRKLLWKQYREAQPDGYGYSQFCYHLSRFRERLEPELRQEYKAGEKLFVDWAGLLLTYSEEGQAREGHVFVATFGASNYTFAQVYPDETLPNWVEAHIEAFEAFGGVPEALVPDNCKTGVTRACYYDPQLNPTYSELADYYHVAVLPQRKYKPQDKAKVETGVQVVEREIIVPLKQQTWLSLGELRHAFAGLLRALNERPFSLLPGSRASTFAELDQPQLQPLPQRRYSCGTWYEVKVANDYHVQVNKHYYSVPYRLIGERVQARVSGQTVELFHGGERVASHVRSTIPGKATTDPLHRPTEHNDLLNRSADQYLAQAGRIGPGTTLALRTLLARYPHPEMAFRGCEGVLRLARQYGHERLEAACEHAVALGEPTYTTIRNLLQNHREHHLLPAEPPVIANRHTRGSDYYRTNP